MSLYLFVTMIGFAVLTAMNLLTGAMKTFNTQIYFSVTLAMLLLYILQRYDLGRKKRIPYLQESIIYVYILIVYFQAIILTIMHPDLPAVTFIGVLLMLPTLFARRPSSLIILQLVMTAVFCTCVNAFKEPAIITSDVWNGLTFCGFSIVILLIVVPIRIRELAYTQKIRHLSDYDLLTGIKNRNSFENFCKDHTEIGKDSLVVYSDVNGLHELNNTKGHAAGDTMLKTVANIIKNQFGEEFTYRIGGDEFVVICTDAKDIDVERALSQIEDQVTKAGYSVSTGFARAASDKEPMETVLRQAESAMYTAKNLYYQNSGKSNHRI